MFAAPKGHTQSIVIKHSVLKEKALFTTCFESKMVQSKAGCWETDVLMRYDELLNPTVLLSQVARGQLVHLLNLSSQRPFWV